MKRMEGSRFCTLLLLIVGLFLGLFLATLPICAQTEQATSTLTKPIEKEPKGKRVFTQHCALCHLPPQEIKPKMRPSSGPILNGLLENAKPGKEESVRELILKGTPHMPGFQYTLDRSEMDDLMAFLKTLNDINAYMNGL